METIEPIKVCATKEEMLGVDGLLLVGNCPVCGQGHLNNKDNLYCGGCGRKVDWTKVTERMKKALRME